MKTQLTPTLISQPDGNFIAYQSANKALREFLMPFDNKPNQKTMKTQPDGNFIASQIEQAFYRIGQSNVSTDVLRVAVQDALEVLSTKFKKFSQDDIAECFRLGALGELTNDVHICARTINTWLNAYDEKVWRFKKPSGPVLELPEAPEEQPRELTKDELEEWLDNACETALNLGFSFPTDYDLLLKYGYISEGYYYDWRNFQMQAKMNLRERRSIKKRSHDDLDIELEAKQLAARQYFLENSRLPK